MGKIKFQVERKNLKDPISVRIIQKQRVGLDSKAKQVEDQLVMYFNNLHIKFAVEERDSLIEFFIEKDSLED